MTNVWDTHASWWRQTFANGADPEYAQQILPLAAQWLAGRQRVLDLGTGEGQLARLACDGGAASVVAIDSSAQMLAEAREQSVSARLVQGSAVALPFAPSSFDAISCALVLEHVEHFEGAIAEIGRVLETNGLLAFFVNHPFVQVPGSGWIEDHVLQERYWRVGNYLLESTVLEEVEAGVRIPFHHRPLSAYVSCLAAAGVVIIDMVEPAPPDEFLQASLEEDSGRHIPRLLALLAKKL